MISRYGLVCRLPGLLYNCLYRIRNQNLEIKMLQSRGRSDILIISLILYGY